MSVTPYARRLRDRVRKELWTGRHWYEDMDVHHKHAICVCQRPRGWRGRPPEWAFRRGHIFTPKRPRSPA